MKCKKCGGKKFYRVFSGWRCENCIELIKVEPKEDEYDKVSRNNRKSSY